MEYEKSNALRVLAILEGTEVITEEMLFEAVEEDKWKQFFDAMVKQSTKVNDKYTSAVQFLKAVVEKAKQLFTMNDLKAKLQRPSTAVLNSELAKIMADVANAAGATLSLINIKNIARAA